MAIGRVTWLWTGGLATALLALGGPLAAQTAPATANSVTPAPTPAPAPADSIGPPQLRDFTLNGTVTRRAEPVAPAPAPTRTAPPAGTGPASTGATPSRAPSTAAPARTDPPVAAPDRDGSAERVTLDLPPPTPAAPDRTMPGFGNVPLATAEPVAAPAEERSIWPWILAALAAALAAGFVGWRKWSGARRPAYAGVSEQLAVPQPTPAVPLPRAAAGPRPAPARAPAPAARPAPPKPAVDGGIVSSSLKPKLVFELRPIRAETDDRRGAALLLDVIVVNNGHAPARDVLVEAQLINAGPRQDEEIGRFFREPIGRGERLPVIPPLGRISLKTKLSIPGDQMQPIEVDGRQLFVPLVAFNALYRWNGGELQDSASFLVGRGESDAGKMAPFRLDQGAKSWTGLGARPHSMGLQQPA